MTQTEIRWASSKFEQLNTKELFEIFKLRQEVFVLEQTCLYPDIDDTDLLAVHLCGWVGQELALYARIIPAGASYPQASIGRIVTASSHRGLGLGRELVAQSISALEQHLGAQEIKIGAQSQLIKFYQDFNFAVVSDEYLEDGIPHIDMLRPKPNQG